MGLLLGIDLGTTFVKAAVFDTRGRMLGLGRVPLSKHERGNTCEMPAAAFWVTVAAAVRESLSAAGVHAFQVGALSYSSQANSFLLLDDAGDDLTPLVLWPDRRAESLNGARSDLWLHDEFLDTTGIGPSSVEFCPHKLEWFRRKEPAIWKKMAMIMTISDYLVFGLTGRRLGDRSTASMLGLWNQRNQCWWRDGLRHLEIPEGALSVPLLPGTCIGTVTAHGAVQIGVAPGTSVVVGALDHYMAGVGAGLGKLADVSESTGTVLACVALSRQYAPRLETCVGPTEVEGRYYYLAFTNCGTTPLDAYRARYMPAVPMETIIRLAENAPAGAIGHCPATPPCDEAVPGPPPDHLPYEGAGHHVRAILEANAFALLGLLNTFPEARPERIVATGGGARSDTWLQLKADVLGMQVIQLDCEEPACQGAAMFAATALKPGGGTGAMVGDFVRVKRRFEPHAARHAEYDEILRQPTPSKA
jgi:xylulokinase